MAAATLGAATAWILTYLIHSSVLIGLALVVSRRLGERRLALQEMLIRAAILGAIATSTVQFSADIRPYAGRFDISGAGARDAGPLPPVFDLVVPIAARPPATLTAPAAIPSPPLAVVASWEVGFVLAWLIGAFVGLLRLVLSRRQLDMLLRLSSPLTDGPLMRTARGLARSLRLPHVRFSSSPAITAPFTTGWRRAEICFPHQALHRLPLQEQEGLCAHELAHVARRDAAWLALYRGIEAVFFFQPLNGWARARLQELAECLADDEAASLTRNRLALARSLVAVAEWTTGTAEPALAVGALSSRSALGRRVERLMVEHPPDASSLRGVVGGSVFILSAAILIVPGVSASSQAPDEPERLVGERAVEVPLPPVAPPAPPVPVAAAPSPLSPAPAPPAPMSAQEPEPPAAPAPPTPPAPVADVEDVEDEDDEELALREAETIERLHEIEAEMERVSDELAERVDERAAEIADIHDSTADMEAALAPTLEQMARLEAQTEALTAARIAAFEANADALAAEMAEIADHQAALAKGALGADGVVADVREAEKLQAVLAAEMREQMAQLHEQFKPSREEMQQLRAEAREIAEAYRPSREQMEELRAVSREMREAMREQQEELRRLAREARELTRDLREQAHRTRNEERLLEQERAREEREREREERRREAEKKRDEEAKKKLEKH